MNVGNNVNIAKNPLSVKKSNIQICDSENIW